MNNKIALYTQLQRKYMIRCINTSSGYVFFFFIYDLDKVIKSIISKVGIEIYLGT